MPTTAEQLEGMTDAGEFEILATQVLRLCHDDCRAIVHTGTNSQGKTIRSPIDGFALVPRSEPPRYVMAAFTLSEDLKRKWLFETEPGQGKASEEGDLVKAAKVAEALRRKDAEAQFCLYLCTNRVPKPELMQEVYPAARNSGIFVEFLDQSGLRDFLDTKADGQYLRQVHLGIAADRLSPPLLHDLSARNLQQYRSETQLGSSRLVRPFGL